MIIPRTLSISNKSATLFYKWKWVFREILNSPLNVMGNLCEIPLVSMVIETTEELLARRNVIATVIPGGGWAPYCTCRNLMQSC